MTKADVGMHHSKPVLKKHRKLAPIQWASFQTNEQTENKVEKKLNMIDDRIRFATFDKTKMKQNKPQPKPKENQTKEEENKETIRKESKKIEEQVQALKKTKLGRVGQVLKLREAISGPKKKAQEAIALQDSRTGELVVSTSEIKRVTTEYCQDLFNNNTPEDDFEEQNYIKHLLHEEIMKDTESGEFEPEECDYWRILERCRRKNKRSYDWLVKSGSQYQEAVFMMIKRMIKDEEFPQSFDHSFLIQLHKSGSFQNLRNSRFIHMKQVRPRITESLVVEGMKDDILAASSKFQIGGQPGMRTNFHLFVLKSVIGIKEKSDQGVIITVADIKQFFDKESLVDCMVTLSEAQIDQKCYRLWWKLNKRVVLQVRTGAGTTDPVEVEGLLSQGSTGAGLVSQFNIDRGIDSYFSNSCDEVFYGTVRLQPLLFMDDCLRLADGVRQAQAGHVKLNYAMKEKLLDFHETKSIYMVYGNQNYKKQVEEEVEESPLSLGDIALKKKSQQKYLGDMLDERGLAASVAATVKDREGKTKAGIYELRSVCQDFRIQILGGMVGALALWETCVLSSLLTNCGTWIDIKEETIKKLDSLQNLFVLVLLKLPHSTPRLAVRAITGLRGMRWRVWKEKLLLVAALRRLDDNTLAKEIFSDQVELGLPGLVLEVKDICKEIGIEDITKNEVSEEEMEDALNINHMKYIKEEMGDKEKYRELKNQDLRKPQKWLEELNLEECCIAMRLKCFMIDCAGNMRARYKGREECIKCRLPPGEEGPGMRETQAHLQICEGYSHLTQNRDLLVLKDKVNYFQDLIKEREKEFIKIRKAKERSKRT